MKRNLLKYLSLVLAMAMLFAIAGCADNGGDPEGSDPAGGNDNGKVATIKLLTWSNAPTVNFLKDIADDFNTAYPAFALEVTDVPSAEHDQVRQTRTTAKDVDVISFQQFSKPQEDWNEASMDMPAWQQYIEENLLVDLSGEEFMDRFTSASKEANRYNGKDYTMAAGTVAYNGLFYNKTIFSDLGLEVPETWDDFVALCQAIKDDGTYGVITTGAADQWPLNMFANGIWSAFYGDDVKEMGKALFLGDLKHTDAEVTAVYQAMDQFASFLEPGITGVSYADVPGRFASGTIAMLADGAWQAPTIDAAEPDFEYGYFALPGPTKRSDGLIPQFAIKYDLSFSVNANSGNTEGALAFLEYFSRKDVYTDFLNAVGGFTPTQDDITLDDVFLNSIIEGLQKPVVNAEHLLYAPKGVGEYGGSNGFSFFYLKTLGGPLTIEEYAELAEADFQTARDAIASLD